MKTIEELVKDIIVMKPMYKEIKDGIEEDIEDEPKGGTKQGNDTIYNYKKRVIRTFIDFDDKKIEKKYIKENFTVEKKRVKLKKKQVLYHMKKQITVIIYQIKKEINIKMKKGIKGLKEKILKKQLNI